ncbi:MAG: hypothetical protein IKT08_07275 [Bacteroidales bacterium]|nr:hypothetical protein [Bacteroidales bacterium]
MNDPTQTPIKRPVGMTILLVLSLLNALLQIFSSFFIYLFLPTLKELLEDGDLETMFQTTMPGVDTSMMETMMDNLTVQLSVNPVYFILICLLYVASLIGVLRMFKLQRIGFHIYSISQMLILVAEVVFLYSKQPQNPFFNEFLMTILLIFIYHLFFKRIEMTSAQNNQPE